MGKRADGFTLIELMIVVAILAILASIVVSNLLSARKAANENAAIATLKNIVGAQAALVARAAVDVDANGSGEFGYLAELAGAVGVRTAAGLPGPDPVQPPVLSPAFGAVAGGGIGGGGAVRRSGYQFQVFLPDAAGVAIAEAPTGGGSGAAPDPVQATSFWCAYAWPLSDATGQRCFFATQSGDILAGRNRLTRYYGANPPPVDAAYAATSIGRMTSTLAANTIGRDGQRWSVVQ